MIRGRMRVFATVLSFLFVPIRLAMLAHARWAER